MRTLLMSLFLAATAAAAPALAAPDDREGRSVRAEKEQDDSDQAQERVRPRQRSERAADSAQPLSASETESPRRLLNGPRGVRSDSADTPDGLAGSRPRQRRQVAESPATGGASEPIGSTGGFRQSDRPLPRVLRNRVPVVSNEPREGSQPPLIARSRTRERSSWSTHWRRDGRYDWTRWRDRHRSRFHLGFYYDPFGWGYRPYSVGWRLWPSYYSSRYWLNDPYFYRLPDAPAGYRWIRYYDDAILVDTWDGHVVDVIYNFFW